MGGAMQRQNRNGSKGRPAEDFVTCSSSSGGLNVVELEFPDSRAVDAGQNVEANTAGRHSGENIDLLMTDGVRGGDGLPGAAGPHVNRIFLDALSVVQPFHGQRTIESDGLVEA